MDGWANIAGDYISCRCLLCGESFLGDSLEENTCPACTKEPRKAAGHVEESAAEIERAVP